MTERFENFNRVYILFKMALDAYNKDSKNDLNRMAVIKEAFCANILSTAQVWIDRDGKLFYKKS